MGNRNQLIDAGADEIQYFIDWMERSVAEDLTNRIYDVWDKGYGAFDKYDETDASKQLDLFDCQLELFEDGPLNRF